MRALRSVISLLAFGFALIAAPSAQAASAVCCKGGSHAGKSHSSSGSPHAKSSGGAVHVRGYTKKNGTVVAPHIRSAPNHTRADNYSTKWNVNPSTGKLGTKSELPSAEHAISGVTGGSTLSARASTGRAAASVAPTSSGKQAATASKGASAQCRDSTYSFSAHRQGTCSHHGGVAAWLK